MAKQQHLDRIRHGKFSTWNRWREDNPDEKPDLREADLRKLNLRGKNLSEAVLCEADLSGADLGETDLFQANLVQANLKRANFTEAVLREADLSGADIRGTNFFRADLVRANLRGAKLRGAGLFQANLVGANLSEANLRKARLIDANLEGTNLSGCHIYGISACNVKTNEETNQSNLVITHSKDLTISADNLVVAYFVNLLLNNPKICPVIDTITSKVVLVLGRFSKDRKAILEVIREALRERDYVPVLFDFEKQLSSDLMETISVLGHISQFVIADITDANCVAQALKHTLPDLPSVPVQPLLQAGADEHGLFEHFTEFSWVLETYQYADLEDVQLSIKEKVIAPVEAKTLELSEVRRNRKA